MSTRIKIWAEPAKGKELVCDLLGASDQSVDNKILKKGESHVIYLKEGLAFECYERPAQTETADEPVRDDAGAPDVIGYVIFRVEKRPPAADKMIDAQVVNLFLALDGHKMVWVDDVDNALQFNDSRSAAQFAVSMDVKKKFPDAVVTEVHWDSSGNPPVFPHHVSRETNPEG